MAIGAGQIAGQRGGVARHHHDALGPSQQDLLDHGSRTLARRIEHGDVEERVARMKVLRPPFANVGRWLSRAAVRRASRRGGVNSIMVVEMPFIASGMDRFQHREEVEDGRRQGLDHGQRITDQACVDL